MSFDIWSQIETRSTVCALEPGDIIATGTPAGVGLSRTPPREFVPGDSVRVVIEGIGGIENPAGAEPHERTEP
jgi:2-keto-4-pentenoate hydratase/2-oxohepta-3-ene-1,7-dioic acid hydratase in catechol pathway